MASLYCKCGDIKCSHTEICFFEQGHEQWHLVVKPEFKAKVLSTLTLQPHPDPRKRAFNPYKLNCTRCEVDVGNVTNVGPNGEALFCFQYKKVSLSKNDAGIAKKWSAARHLHPNIEVRGRNILKGSASFPPGQSGPSTSRKAMYSPLRRANEEDVMCTSLATFVCAGKVPRMYQVELFVEAMLKDTVIVLPTGAGKTLVAAMVVRRILELNQKKVAVLLADRIPLVHQQARVLQDVGGLRVKEFTGDNSTSFKMSPPEELEALLRSIDVLVLTAQVFLNKLNDGFPMSSCCLLVFDEAHHAKRHHAFATIMQFHSTCDFELRPQILGLTASPGGELTLEKTSAQLESLARVYNGASLIMPAIYCWEMEEFTNQVDTVCRLVIPTHEESIFHSELESYMRRVFQWVEFLAANCGAQLPTKKLAELEEGQRRGALRSLSDSSKTIGSRALHVAAEHGLRILTMYTRSTVIGPCAARHELAIYHRRLQNEQEAGNLFRRLSWPATWAAADELQKLDVLEPCHFSARVRILIEEIKTVEANHRNPRLIVFVQRRSSARELVKILGAIPEFRRLRPGLLVGHSGFDGMTWEEEQKPMLERFHSGSVKLLVATSVAEEGLDVPACNTVVRFDCTLSMTAVVQSRGRARARFSRFVLLVDPVEKKMWDETVMREKNMLHAVKQRQGTTAFRTERLLNHLAKQLKESTDAQNHQENQRVGAASDVDGQMLDKSAAFPREAGTRQRQSSAGAAHILEGHDLVVTVLNLPRSATEREVIGIFLGLASVVHCGLTSGLQAGWALVHLRTPDSSISADACYLRILQEASLVLRGCPVWLQRNNQTALSPHVSQAVRSSQEQGQGGIASCPRLVRCTLGCFRSAGQFEGVFDFEESYSLSSEEDFTSPDAGIMLSCQSEKGAIHVEGHDLYIEMFASSVHEPVIVHRNQRRQGILAVYIHLKQVPRLYRKVIKADLEPSWARIAEHSSELHRVVGSFFVYRFEWCDADMSETLKDIMALLGSLGIDIVDGRICDSAYQPWWQGKDESGVSDIGADSRIVGHTRGSQREAWSCKWETNRNDGFSMETSAGQDVWEAGTNMVRSTWYDSSGDAVNTEHAVEFINEGENDDEDDDSIEAAFSDDGTVGELDWKSSMQSHQEIDGTKGLSKMEEGITLPPDPLQEGGSDCHTRPLENPWEANTGLKETRLAFPLPALPTALEIEAATAEEGSQLAFDARFLVECFKSQCGHLLPGGRLPPQFFQQLQKYTPEQRVWALLNVPTLFRQFSEPVGVLEASAAKPMPPWGPSLLPVPAHHVAVRRVMVTPTCLQCSPAEAIHLNVVLRHVLHEKEYDPGLFLIVTFRDENGHFIHGPEKLLLERVRNLLLEGLVVAGRQFRFLAASSSQVRSHACWMTSLASEKIWSWQGEFDSIRCPAKYMARLGQDFAASYTTISVKSSCLEEDSIAPDISRTINGAAYCFTDGSGKISFAARNAVVESLATQGVLQSPSAPTSMAVRVGGCKGVLTVDSRLPSNGSQVILRKSMQKFRSSRRELAVLSIAKNQEVFLNRQAITLLHARGVDDSVFEDLQERHLDSILHILTEEGAAWAALSACCQLPSRIKLGALRDAELDIFEDPVLKAMLSSAYHHQVRSLAEKSRLWVPEGRLLLGVPDDRGVLQEGEIFVQLSGPLLSPWGDRSPEEWPGGAGSRIVEGPCAVYRLPCMHPGDVRVLHARDDATVRDALARDHMDVIVFSTKGSRPEADKMSGGDLDGDKFSVLYQTDLIPTEDYEPMDFSPGKALEIDEPVRLHHMTQSFVDLMGNSQLGKIANAHLALCDARQTGAKDKDCIELAELHHRAVDAPKTGWTGGIPMRLLTEEFPDYMEKHDRPMRRSETILGRLYRRVRCADTSDIDAAAENEVGIDRHMLETGYEQHLEESKGMYAMYCQSLRALKRKFGIMTEGELMTGYARKVHSHLDRFKAGQEAQIQFQALHEYFRQMFDSRCEQEELERLKRHEQEQTVSGLELASSLDQAESERGKQGHITAKGCPPAGPIRKALCSADETHSQVADGEENEEAVRQSLKGVRYMRAAAWYWIAYTDKSIQDSCHSFAWVVMDLLLMNKCRNSHRLKMQKPLGGNVTAHSTQLQSVSFQTAARRPSLGERLTENIMLQFAKSKTMLFSSFLERLALVEQVETCAEALDDCHSSTGCYSAQMPSWPPVYAFGSSATFLFDPYTSDVDICILPTAFGSTLQCHDPPKAAQVARLKDFLPLLKQDFPNVHLKEGPRVPILRFEGNANHPLPFDVSASWGGLQKSTLLRRLVKAYPALFLLLRVVVQWTRLAGISTGQGAISPDGVSWLFIAFCLCQGYIKDADWTTAKDAARDMKAHREMDSTGLLDFWSSVLDRISGQWLVATDSGSHPMSEGRAEDGLHVDSPKNCERTEACRMAGGSLIGDVLLHFFKELSQVSCSRLPGAPGHSPLTVPNPFEPGRPCVELDESSMCDLQNKCLQASHLLSRTASVAGLLIAVTRHVRMRLNRQVSRLFRGCEAFTARRLSLLSGGRATVTVGPIVDNYRLAMGSDRAGPPRMYVEIHGEGAAVHAIEHHLKGLQESSVVTLQGGRAKFVEGSICHMFEGSLSDSDELGFLEYTGPCHFQHNMSKLHTVRLLPEMGGSSWKAHALGKLRSATWRQRGLLLQSPDEVGEVSVVIRFGTGYVINLPRAFHGESLGCLPVVGFEEALVKGRHHIKPWERRSAKGNNRGDEQESARRAAEEFSKPYLQKTHKLQSGGTVEGTKKKQFKQTVISQSLFNHVVKPLHGLRQFLDSHGAVRFVEPTTYRVTVVGSGNEARVMLDDRLKFIQASERPVRWLAASLTLAPTAEDGILAEAGTPRTIRFYVLTERNLGPDSELVIKVKQCPLLVTSTQGNGGVFVGDKFQSQVGHVRKVATERFDLSHKDLGGHLRVDISTVEEWAAWDRRGKAFRSHREHVEVTLKVADAGHVLRRGSTQQLELLIRNMWNAGMGFAPFVL